MRSRVLTFILLAAGAPVLAQAPARGGFRDTVTIVPGAHYARSGAYRFFFGAHYRDLWTTPIRVPVIDLGTFGGGLKPLQRGGGQQTKSLRFSGGDGRQYQFRSVDKDPSAALPADLRETFADRIFQDQISSAHPVGGLVVPPILQAAGVLHAPPTLAVLPDDPALGEFRAEFANLLGTIEERPRDADEEGMSFAGAREIVSTDRLIRELERNPAVPVDTRAFLRARLVDVFLGDWDRHRDQWRWALVDDAPGPRWLPIPRDRDQALARFDGFLLGQVRKQFPQLVNFGPAYPSIIGATWNGRDLDRRLLTDLQWDTWDSVASDLRGRLTDGVIEEAVSRLPAEFRAIDGPRLSQALRARRDAMLPMTLRYYHHLAGQVDVHASDRDDEVVVDRITRRVLDVSVRDAASGVEWYRRRFDKDETKDVRVYLHGGNDRAIERGTGEVGTTVRFIGGAGDDLFADSARGHTRFYDVRGATVARGGPVDARPYQAIDTTRPNALPHRDWGRSAVTTPYASVGPDAGLILGWMGRLTGYGFRKKPWASRFSFSVQVATGASTGRVEASYRSMQENTKSFWSIQGLASGIEVLRWHGFGNGTTLDSTLGSALTEFYRVTQQQVAIEPSLGWALGERATLTLGPRFKYSKTELTGRNATRFIRQDQPFGIRDFDQLGVGAELEVDTRDLELAARRGVHLTLGGRFFPAVLDVTDAFGSVYGEGSTYLTAGPATLALRAGGKKIWGTGGAIPFHEAALLGSNRTLRGFRSSRFAGDEGVAYGSAELRLHLTNLFIFVPGRQGVYGFYDVGRVFHSTDVDANDWHSGVGGGVWLSFVTPGSLVSGGVGHSDEGNRFYVRVGFAF